MLGYKSLGFKKLAANTTTLQKSFKNISKITFKKVFFKFQKQGRFAKSRKIIVVNGCGAVGGWMFLRHFKDCYNIQIFFCKKQTFETVAWSKPKYLRRTITKK